MTFQYPLPLTYPPIFDEEDFFVSESNHQAAQDLFRFPIFSLFGPKGCGKTHLSRIWQKRFGAHLLSAEELTEAFLSDSFSKTPALILENIETLPNESLLFHLLNMAKESQTKLLLTGNRFPDEEVFRLPDLLSRLRSYPFALIHPPDDALIVALLVKQFRDLQISVPHELMPYVLKRIHRSFEAVQTFVQRMDQLSLSQKRPLTIALARQALDDKTPL